MPKLSIVVPVYNTEKYLNQCIDSILGQTFTDFELIIINDGSKDGSGIICDQYAKKDPRIFVIHTENHGVVTARKTGVNFAKGEYTAFVDSDDWLDLDYYNSVFDELTEENADVLVCTRMCRAIGCVKTTEFSAGFYNKPDLGNTIHPKMLYDMSRECFNIDPSLCDKLFRTELLKDVYAGVDPDVTLGEDAVCTFPCIARANSLFIIDNKSCYNYREDHISMVNSCDVRLLQRVCALAVSMNRQFSKLSSNFDSQVQCFISYNGLYAARQVLVLNREMKLSKKVKAVKEFFAKPEMVYAFRTAIKSPCSHRYKLYLSLAVINQPYLLMLFKSNCLIQKIKSYFSKD